MRLSGLKLIASFFLAAVLSAPVWAATPALPGTLNYVEGQASIGTETLNAKSVGSVDLQTGQTLSTETGKAEVLLTPGVFFRLGDNSAATLVSPSLTNTEMALNNGQALVEVDEIHKDNLLRIQQDGATTQLLKAGVYGFNATNGEVQVFQGEALVRDGDRQIKVRSGHELDVQNAANLKPAKFDKSAYEQSDLYRFSNLRSQYLGEANVDAARVYVAGGAGWWGPGWYWNPFFASYTWIPGNGMFVSPFGWGFYSPMWIGYYGVPYYYRGFYGRYGVSETARPYVRGQHPAAAPSHAFVGGSHFGGVGSGGFHGGMSGEFHGAGMRG